MKFDEAPYKEAHVWTMPHDFSTLKEIFEDSYGVDIVELPFIDNKNGVIIYSNKSIPVTLLNPIKRNYSVIGDLTPMIPDMEIDDCVDCDMTLFLDNKGSSPVDCAYNPY